MPNLRSSSSKSKVSPLPSLDLSAFDGIEVKGAREHNLKNVSVRIPRHRVTVITGLSGSGKSSLAFDTIYAEGQRRYVEGLSAYARNFLQQLKKPEVESVTGLSPAIAIDQKSVGSNPRSTVGTITEISDYLRLLFAKLGVPECPTHRLPVSSQTPTQIIDEVLSKYQNQRVFVMAPMARGKKGEFLAEFQKWQKRGYARALVDGAWVELAKAAKLVKTKEHDIDLLVDHLTVGLTSRSRLVESIHAALVLANGRVHVQTGDGKSSQHSIHSACPVCSYGFPDLEPRFFSFNNPRGACVVCKGLGTTDIEEVEVQEGDRPRPGSAVKVYRRKGGKSIDGDEEEETPEPELQVCPGCHGTRLKPEVLSVRFFGKNIAELSETSTVELLRWLKTCSLEPRQQLIGEKILVQICSRLAYLERVGTGYLNLARPARTLSGGEAQRIRLATQVGSALIGVLYVMDEPSIGLHPGDHERLLEILGELRDRGNTILLVEHDEDTILSADHVVDLGPGAGRLGGELIAEGSPQQVKDNPRSLTGQYLSGAKFIPVPARRRAGNGNWLSLEGATGNNLQNLDFRIPLGAWTVVTGVSGSGKSTLVIDTLYRAIAARLNRSTLVPAPFRNLKGLEHIDKVVEINQRPIGRTPRSTPATYVGLLPLVRDLFASLPDAKVRGFTPGRFSFNVKGGRCENCLGHGQVRMEMHFLADVFVQCEQCQGKRYNRETLQVRYNKKNISEVLEMNVADALEFFANHSAIRKKLETLHRVGLEYMTLGQSSTSLSGGEAQRVKLSKELSKRATGRTLYILDEPTTGLHFADIAKLIELLQELTDQGNTMLVIEHNLDVVKNADYVVDVGPLGGSGGGQIVGQGSPEELARVSESATGKFLLKVLSRGKPRVTT